MCRRVISFASNPWRCQNTIRTSLISLRRKMTPSDEKDPPKTLASVDCTRGYIRPLPFFLATPSLKRSRGQLEEEMSGIGGTATLAAMDRSFSILHWPPGSVGRNLSSESLERVSSVFPSFESAPRRWGSNPSSGITWRISFRSQALAQKACRLPRKLVVLPWAWCPLA